MYRFIGLVGRVFANGLGDLVSIPDCVIPKTLKMVLDTFLLNTQQYKVRIKGKVVQSPTSHCSRYWKGSLLVAIFTFIYIYSSLLFFLIFFTIDACKVECKPTYDLNLEETILFSGLITTMRLTIYLAKILKSSLSRLYIYPTLLRGQDLTKGQLFSGVVLVLNSESYLLLEIATILGIW